MVSRLHSLWNECGNDLVLELVQHRAFCKIVLLEIDVALFGAGSQEHGQCASWINIMVSFSILAGANLKEKKKKEMFFSALPLICGSAAMCMTAAAASSGLA